MQSRQAGTERLLVPRELILYISTGLWKMGSPTQASIALLQNILVLEGQICCLQSILVFQVTFFFFFNVLVPGH